MQTSGGSAVDSISIKLDTHQAFENLQRQFDLHRLPKPQHSALTIEQNGIHAKADAAIKQGIRAIVLQNIERIWPGYAAVLINRRNRAARARLDGLDPGVAKFNVLGKVFFKSRYAIDHDIRPEAVHRQSRAACRDQPGIEIIQ